MYADFQTIVPPAVVLKTASCIASLINGLFEDVPETERLTRAALQEHDHKSVPFRPNLIEIDENQGWQLVNNNV